MKHPYLAEKTHGFPVDFSTHPWAEFEIISTNPWAEFESSSFESIPIPVMSPNFQIPHRTSDQPKHCVSGTSQEQHLSGATAQRWTTQVIHQFSNWEITPA